MHISELDTPAMVIDLERLERNIRAMADYCAAHGLSLRPHIKTHKNPAIARMQIQAGACGITVAKPGEAAVMAGEGIDDILIAYPIVGAAKLERLVSLARDVRITVALDSLEVAEGISGAAASAGVTVRVLAELDAGLRHPVRRHGGERAAQARALLRRRVDGGSDRRQDSTGRSGEQILFRWQDPSGDDRRLGISALQCQ